MDFIGEFIGRYTKEWDFYDQAANLARQKLEADLTAAGVHQIVTARAKSISRLEDKCRTRNGRPGREYSSMDDIYDDIVDLAGVRVALYFPGEFDQVYGAITRLFNVITEKRFPEEGESYKEKRFSGYSARHYRVQLKEDKLSDAEKRYAAARIEIQVASVLMHAWSEVEHDLAYKPMAGELSEAERAMLDQLNGLVLSGEIALEMLQKASAARIAEGDKQFANHYDLAVHLLSAAEKISDIPVNDSGLGRIDLLFDLIKVLKVDTPDKLRPYIDVLHGNVEERPLSEQIIDALLAEDPERYRIYESIRAQRPWVTVRTERDNEIYQHVGMFLTRWIQLEGQLRELFGKDVGNRRILPTTGNLAASRLFSDEFIREFDYLRRMRNNLVHGVEIPSTETLKEAADRIDALIEELRRLRGLGDTEFPG